MPNEIEGWEKESLEERKEKKRARIIFDGKQYTIKIPKDFAEAIELDNKKKEIKFTLIMPPINSKEKTELKMEIVDVRTN